MRIGYARVSTKEQSLQSQVDALKHAACDKVYSEVASGAKTQRPVLDELLAHLRKGDVLVIYKLDRLGRSLQHIVTLSNELMEREIGLISLSDPIDTTTSQGRLVCNIFAALAEFERELIRERTQAGLLAARTRTERRSSERVITSSTCDSDGGRDTLRRGTAVCQGHL